MTSKELTKKYPIGTNIRFLCAYEDTGKLGKIVGFHGDWPIVYLPTGDKHIKRNRYPVLSDGTKFTWRCPWREIEPITLKGEQLLFDFAY